MYAIVQEDCFSPCICGQHVPKRHQLPPTLRANIPTKYLYRRGIHSN